MNGTCQPQNEAMCLHLEGTSTSAWNPAKGPSCQKQRRGLLAYPTSPRTRFLQEGRKDAPKNKSSIPMRQCMAAQWLWNEACHHKRCNWKACKCKHLQHPICNFSGKRSFSNKKCSYFQNVRMITVRTAFLIFSSEQALAKMMQFTKPSVSFRKSKSKTNVLFSAEAAAFL